VDEEGGEEGGEEGEGRQRQMRSLSASKSDHGLLDTPAPNGMRESRMSAPYRSRVTASRLLIQHEVIRGRMCDGACAMLCAPRRVCTGPRSSSVLPSTLHSSAPPSSLPHPSSSCLRALLSSHLEFACKQAPRTQTSTHLRVVSPICHRLWSNVRTASTSACTHKNAYKYICVHICVCAYTHTYT